MDKKRDLMQRLQKELKLTGLEAEHVNNILDVIYLEGKIDGMKQAREALQEPEMTFKEKWEEARNK